MTDYAKTGFSRVFLIEGGARPDHAPAYQGCMKAGGVSKSWGDLTSVECPSQVQYDSYTEVDTIKGAEERATMDLIGRYLADVASELLRIGNIGCGVDAQVHFGKCADPTAFNTFTKAVVLEGAFISDWSTDELGAVESGERSPVFETGSISSKDVYEILQIVLAEAAASIVTTEVLDVTVCDQIACGECDEDSSGCQHIYAVTLQAGGSPGTPPDIVFTIDGSNWYADDIDSLGAAEDPSAIDCLGLYAVIVSNDSGSAHYALLSEINDVDYDETWTEITTGFVGAPNDCHRAVGGRYLYVVGDSGYIYRTDDITAGVTALDAGVATSENLNRVFALTDEFVVAVGANNTVVYTEDGTSWSTVTGPLAGTNLTAIEVVSEVTWFVGATAYLYYTVDKAANWTAKGFPGSGAGVVHDLSFANGSVGYMAHATAAPAGRILRTYDGGYSWSILPEGTGTITANDRINRVIACSHDQNFVVGVGLDDTTTDGVIVVGRD